MIAPQNQRFDQLRVSFGPSQEKAIFSRTTGRRLSGTIWSVVRTVNFSLMRGAEAIRGF